MGSAASVSEVALEMACGPVSDSMSTELTKSTLQAGISPPREESVGPQWGGRGGGGVDDTPRQLFGEKEWMNSRPAPQPGICTDMWTAWRYSGLQGGTGQARGEGRSPRGDPGWGGHSPAPCFSRSVVELAEPELAFDSSVGSETKV